MKKSKLFILPLVMLLMACNNDKKTKEVAEEQGIKESSREKQLPVLGDIEEAHQKARVMQTGLIQFDLNLTFSGKQRFDGTIAMTPSGGKVKMSDSAKTVLWDGKDVLVSPKQADAEKARFDVLTWSYFFAVPYKLSDQGVKHEYLSSRPLAGENYEASKMTFDSGVGDSPDDWYIIYKDSETNFLAAMAYIVTLNKSQAEAEKDPHAITYEAYVEVDGVPIATLWNFWSWNEDGELNKLLGTARISNVSFQKKVGETFQLKGSRKKIEKPT